MIQSDKHYHTIPYDEWQAKWLPLEQENADLKNELERKNIDVRLNRRHYGGSFWDETVKVGYYEIDVSLPHNLKIDKDHVKKILLEHEQDDEYGYIYSEQHAAKVRQGIVDKITQQQEVEESIQKYIRRNSRIMRVLAALLIVNLIIVYKYYV